MRNTPDMPTVAAQQIHPQAPADLEALLLCERPPDGPTRRLCAVGDIGFSGKIAEHLDVETFREVAPVLRAADLAFANLETALTEDFVPEMIFAAPIRSAPFLAEAGFKLINLANNHVLDYGEASLAVTRETLEKLDLDIVGAGPDPATAKSLVVQDLDGLRVGWLGCARTLASQEPGSETFWEYDPEALSEAIRDARSRVDVLVVSIHMGYMYVGYPHPEHRRDALAFVTEGADIVLMHHAHILQGVEVVAGRPICYNLGNFLFDWTAGVLAVDQMHEEQRTGGLFVFELDRQGVCRGGVLPIRVDDRWNVGWAKEETGTAILNRLRRLSNDWGAGATAGFHRQMAERITGHAVRAVYWELRREGLKAIPVILGRVRPHHLRMVAGWPVQRLKRWLQPNRTPDRNRT